jgi:hypothetical protein
MGLLSRVRRREHGGASQAGAVATSATTADVIALRHEIATLSTENRRGRDGETERRLLALRQDAGIAELRRAPRSIQFAPADPDGLDLEQRVPEVTPEALTPGNLRAGILQAGCVLVRRLVPQDEAERFAQEIERAWRARERLRQDGADTDGYYEEFSPRVGTGVLGRPWLEKGGNLLAADSPRLFFQMIELFERANLPALVAGYLGETPLISLQKSTLRKADPTVPGAWHQDGKFLGPVRALNLWLSLSRCGEDAPGLDILPRRLESYLPTGTDDAPLDWTISQRQVDTAAGEDPILRPAFHPGDALLFDELFLHQTATDPAMTRPRYAIENWFFGASQFPGDYAPLVL